MEKLLLTFGTQGHLETWTFHDIELLLPGVTSTAQATFHLPH